MATATKAAAPAPSPLRILRGHGAPVHAVCTLPRSRIASGSADGVLKVWDLRTAREQSSVHAHSTAGILHTATLDDHRIVTHGRDGYVKVWDTDSLSAESQPIHSWYCGSFTFTKAATMRWRGDAGSSHFDDVVVAPSAEEKDILVFDPRESSTHPAMFIHTEDAGKKRGMCMSLSLFTTTSSNSSGGGQTFIAAGWEGGQFTLHDLRVGGKVATETQVSTGTDPLLAFDVSVDGSTAICGSSAEELSSVSIDYSSLTMVSSPFFKCNHGGINFIRLRQDQRIFATAGWDHRVRVFHTRKLKPLAILKYHTESVFSVDFTPDSNFLVTASKDHKIATWSIYPPSAEAAQEALKPWMGGSQQ